MAISTYHRIIFNSVPLLKIDLNNNITFVEAAFRLGHAMVGSFGGRQAALQLLKSVHTATQSAA